VPFPGILSAGFDDDIQIAVDIEHDHSNRTVFRALKSEICVAVAYPEPMKFKPPYKFRQDGMTNA
jgi:hypothetical protein